MTSFFLRLCKSLLLEVLISYIKPFVDDISLFLAAHVLVESCVKSALIQGDLRTVLETYINILSSSIRSPLVNAC